MKLSEDLRFIATRRVDDWEADIINKAADEIERLQAGWEADGKDADLLIDKNTLLQSRAQKAEARVAALREASVIVKSRWDDFKYYTNFFGAKDFEHNLVAAIANLSARAKADDAAGEKDALTTEGSE